MKRRNTATTAGNQLDFFGIIDNMASNIISNKTDYTFDDLFNDAEEDPTADTDPNTDYFSEGDRAYYANFLNPAAGMVIKVNNSYNPGRKAAALITIRTEEGAIITDYQSNFTRTRPAVLDFYKVQ